MGRQKLDLHGVKHNEVESVIDSFFYQFGVPFEVVTGNSIKMREVVLDVLDDYGFDYFDINTGSIMVVERGIE